MARDLLAPPKPGSKERRKRLFDRKPQTHASFAITQPQVNAKVSSAALRKVGDDGREHRRARRRIAQQDRTWQASSFDFIDKVGELGYLINLQANVVSLGDFPVRRWDEESTSWKANEPDDEENYSAEPDEVMKAFVGPQGGTRELIRRAAFNLFATGETHLLGAEFDGGDGLLWEFLSVEELYPDADGQYIRRRSGMTMEGMEAVGEDTYVARCWRSSARFSELADCEVRRVLPILQEIVNLTEMVDATIKSRIPAGLLFIPEELTFPRDDDDEDAALDADDIDAFIDELMEHLVTPVTDPGSAARLVPLVVRGPAEQGQHIRVIDLARAVDSWAQELRQEALGRLSHGLDTPPEIMSGRANVNHWTSAIIDHDFILKHIVPIGQLLADFITIAFLRPMLEVFYDMSAEDAAHWRLEYDPSPLTSRHDESKSARDMAEWLSDEALVTANGFTKADMVPDEQKLERRLWQLVRSAPSVFAPLLNQIPGMENVDMSEVIAAAQAAEDIAAGDGDPLLDGDDALIPDDPDFVDATTGEEVPDRPEGLSLLTERLAVAADASVRRAMERAGSRMVSLAQGDDMLRDRIRSVRKDRVMSLVAESDLSRFSVSRDKLLDGAWSDLSSSTRAWVRDHLETDGMDPSLADEIGAFAAHRLCEQINELVRDKLLDDFRPGKNGLRVPYSVVAAVLDEAVYARSG